MIILFIIFKMGQFVIFKWNMSLLMYLFLVGRIYSKCCLIYMYDATNLSYFCVGGPCNFLSSGIIIKLTKTELWIDTYLVISRSIYWTKFLCFLQSYKIENTFAAISTEVVLFLLNNYQNRHQRTAAQIWGAVWCFRFGV